VLARLRNRRFFSLADLNIAIHECVADLNAKIMRKLGKSRRELLETIERPALKALPTERVDRTAPEFARHRPNRAGDMIQYLPTLLIFQDSLPRVG